MCGIRMIVPCHPHQFGDHMSCRALSIIKAMHTSKFVN